jgi:tetratricopeptide (TPR) repeat protein
MLTNNRRYKQSDLDIRLVELKSLALNIIATEPKNTDALNSLGLVSLQLKIFDEAIGFFEQAHKLTPNRQDYINNLIQALELSSKNMCDLGCLPASINLLEKALLLRPNNVMLKCRLAVVLGLSNRNEEALVASEQALLIDPKTAQAYEAQGLALTNLGQANLAITSFKQALECGEPSASTYSNLGLAYRAKGEIKGAIDYFEKAVALDKNYKQAYNNLGVSFLELNELGQAEAALKNALTIDQEFAEAHFNLSRVLLMGEDFEAGWKHNEWRWLCSTFPSTWREFPQVVWQGEDLTNKKILVWSEQGIGDEVMFASTLQELAQNSAGLVIECNKRLVPIFKRSFKGVSVFARHQPSNPQIRNINADVQIPLASICNFYRKAPEEFPSSPNGYLKSDPILTEKIKSRYSSFGDGIKVGVSWKSGNPIVGHERSIPIELWHELFALKGCHFISVQYGEFGGDLERVFKATGIRIFQDKLVNPINSAEEWFSQIGALDHIISVDNSTIQVSGSLGIPTWTLLSSAPEWRFGLKRSDHLWHPSVQVYRQKRKGEWGPLMKKVASDFTSLIES